jgi:hypothetical protein
VIKHQNSQSIFWACSKSKTFIVFLGPGRPFEVLPPKIPLLEGQSRQGGQKAPVSPWWPVRAILQRPKPALEIFQEITMTRFFAIVFTAAFFAG